jgi:hypothetical protein
MHRHLSTPIRVCHIKREHSHKMFKGMATKGKSTVGWFFSFKLHDKIILRKRAIIETINDQLKNIYQIEHTRYRCLVNFTSNLISGLIAYNLMPKKPSLNLDIIDYDKLNLIA